VSKSLDELKAVGFLEREEEEGWTWICDFLDHNPIPNGNVGKAIGKLLEQTPQSVAFYERVLDVVAGSCVDRNLIDTLRERYRDRFDRVPEPFYDSERDLKPTLRLKNTLTTKNTNTRPRVFLQKVILRSWQHSTPRTKQQLAIHDGQRHKTSAQYDTEH
jgi:hypothetical protein